MDFWEAIRGRRSIRQYRSEPIAPELLEKIVSAGLYAPSARNNQPWEFLVVTERQTLTELSAVRPYWHMLASAAACIVVLNTSARSYSSPCTAFSVQDCAAATENILLTAHSVGVGGVWLGLYPLEEERQTVRKLLQIPQPVEPFSIVSLGYPAYKPAQEKKKPTEKIHWERYDSSCSVIEDSL